ncbi:hypothetical protein [Cupriavidus sp. YAF13]|uniref:hypothetical protein n=1 Tax=Cupriavidus sp. YAF13 TaxID=3233075 RepID=UPI003F90DA74
MSPVNNAVVHLTMRFQNTSLATGTGVMYRRHDEYFIVTAWHNLAGRHIETLVPLDKKNAAIPDNVVASVALRMGVSHSIRMSFTLPLQDDTKSLFYVSSKNFPRVDVAVIPFDPNQPHKMETRSSDGEERDIVYIPHSGDGDTMSRVVPIQDFLPPGDVSDKWLEAVDVTEELFIPGYPQNLGDYTGQPVWKRATIASSVQNGWNNQAQFLVDSASKSGMSGAPVVFYSPNGTLKIGGATYKNSRPFAILAGIYTGRLGITTKEDPQVGTVWHRSVIDEVINDRVFERLPYEIVAGDDELQAAVHETFKILSKKGLENVLNKSTAARYYSQNEVLGIMNGRVSPDKALAAVLLVAEYYDGPFVADN